MARNRSSKGEIFSSVSESNEITSPRNAQRISNSWISANNPPTLSTRRVSTWLIHEFSICSTWVLSRSSDFVHIMNFLRLGSIHNSIFARLRCRFIRKSSWLSRLVDLRSFIVDWKIKGNSVLTSEIVNLIDRMTCNIDRESDGDIVRADLVQLRRIVRKCWSTSEGDDPVMKAYDWRASRGFTRSNVWSTRFRRVVREVVNRSRKDW